MQYDPMMEIFGHSIPLFLLIKGGVLLVVAMAVNFIYSYRTGRDLTTDRNLLAQQQHRAAESGQAAPGTTVR